MKKIISTAYIVIAALLFIHSANALYIENSSTCVSSPVAGTYTGSVVNSVSSHCTTKSLVTLTNKSGTSYGVFAECSACSSGYYLSDTLTYRSHSTCGKIGYQATCMEKKTCSASSSSAAASTVTGCTSAYKTTFGGTTFYTCNTCSSGYTRTAVSVSDQQCTNTTTRYYCKASTTTSCDSSTCVPDADWTCGSAGSSVPEEGVCMRNYRGCSNNTCMVQTIWQCQDGWYGSPATNGYHCTKCPESADGATVYTLDTAKGMPMNSNTTISKCYVKDGKDATGQFEYTTTSGRDVVSYTCYYSGQ